MPQPPAYNRTKDFTENFGTETDHSGLNAELDKVSNSINDVRTNLAILQADDGKLRPEVVTVDSLNPAVRDALVAQVEEDAVFLLADANAASDNAIARANEAAGYASAAGAHRAAAEQAEADAKAYAEAAQAAIGQPADGTVTADKIPNTDSVLDAIVAKLKFLAAGVGAIYRGLRDKLRESVSVADYGAVGDGVADDSAAFTKALAAHNHVMIPDGFLCRVQNVFVGDDKEIFARGNGGIYVAAGTTGLVLGTDASLPGRHAFVKNARIHDLRVVGADLSAGTYGIRVNQAVSCRIFNISYQKTEAVIYQQCADGCTFEGFQNVNLEDVATDCNHIVKAAISVRNNDNDYRGFIGRAKKQALFLDAVVAGDPEAIHDGVSIVGNTLFPNSTAGADTVFVKNAIWLVVSNNKFFEPQRHGVRVEGSCINVNIENNQFAFPGKSEPGYGVSIVTPSGSAAGAFGSVAINGNTIVTPSGHGIDVVGVRGLNIFGNLISAPNNQYAYASPAFTYSGIHLTRCGDYHISGNKVGTTTDGRNSVLTPRLWKWDVFIEADCTFGTVDHASDLGNATMVYDASRYAQISDRVPALMQPPLSINAQNGVDPYYGNPGAWTLSACTVASVTDAGNPSPAKPAANNTIEIAFTAQGGFAQVGANQTFEGGQLWAEFYAKCVSGNAVLTGQLQPNGGTDVPTQFVLDSTYRRILMQCPNTVAAGYSLFTLSNSGQAAATVRIAGLNITTTRAPMPLGFKVCYGTAAPAAGFWNKGDRVINSEPTAGQPKAWVCTTTGNPGLWASEGNL